MKIQNAVALITGANRGIGKALVEVLLKSGTKKIYATARNMNSLSHLLKDERIVPLSLDVTDQESLDAAAKQAEDVNLLINNAGVLDFGDILTVTKDQIDHNFSVNFYGTLATTRTFIPVIEANDGGSIVNMLTLLSLASMPGLATYNASKAAAWSMHLSLRASLSKNKIDVHGVFPGAVDTDMLAGVDMPKANALDVADKIVEGIIQGKEDIFPDSVSAETYTAWAKDHKAVEKQFAQM